MSLWDKIDEVSPSDTDYIYTATSNDIAEVKLDTFTAPLTSGIVRVRAKDDGTGRTLTTKVVQGTTVLETFTDTLSSTLTTYTHTLSSPSSLTDGSDVRLRFSVS